MVNGNGTVDSVVIGGGPAGSSAALQLASRGHSVTVIERKKEIGKPVHCGECISGNTREYAGIDQDGESIVGKVSGYRIISPSDDSLFSSTIGYNIDRTVFDRNISEMALAEGARILTGTVAENISREEGLYRIRTTKGPIMSGSLVIACGASPFMLDMVLENGCHRCMRAVGAKVEMKDESNEIRFYVKGSLKGGYGYYFPRGDEVNVGLVAERNVKEEFESLMKRIGISRSSIISYHGGLIPVSGMGKVNPMDDCIMVGDAGGFSNPVSKGGIIGSLISGREGGKALSEKLSGNEAALIEWEKRMTSHPAFDRMNLERIDILGSLDDRALDQLTSITKGRDVWSIRKTELIREAWKRPELLRLAKGSVRLIKGFRHWARWSF